MRCAAHVRERCERDHEGVKRILEADQKRWQKNASWHAISNVSTVTREDVSTLFFDRVFKVGERQVAVRFAMVWIKGGGTWKLAQSSTTVPTTEQSAEDFVRAAAKQYP